MAVLFHICFFFFPMLLSGVGCFLTYFPPFFVRSWLIVVIFIYFSFVCQELVVFHFSSGVDVVSDVFDFFYILLLHVSVCMYVSVRVCALCVCAFGGLDASITSVCSYGFAS